MHLFFLKNRYTYLFSELVFLSICIFSCKQKNKNYGKHRLFWLGSIMSPDHNLAVKIPFFRVVNFMSSNRHINSWNCTVAVIKNTEGFSAFWKWSWQFSLNFCMYNHCSRIYTNFLFLKNIFQVSKVYFWVIVMLVIIKVLL